jgi:hypothetical protein
VSRFEVPARASFVVGTGRSGTTLLVALLDGHPDLLVLPHESKAVSWHGARDPVAKLYQVTPYGERFPDDAAARERFDADLRARLDGPTDLGTALLALVEAVGHVRPVETATRWLEKTPKHLRAVPLLLARFGADTRVIGIVRDPRATFLSRSRRWNRRGPQAIRTFARRWAFDDALLRHFEAHSPGFMTVRYEDLVRETESSMRAVAAHLGIAWHPVLLEPTRTGGVYASNSSFVVQSRLDPTPLERYRKELESDVIAGVERLLGARMRLYGYEPESPTTGIGRIAQLWNELGVWRRMLRERWRWRRGLAKLPRAD